MYVEGKGPEDLVFTRTRKDGTHVPVGKFRKTWKNATEAAGVPWLRVHDLRRTGARNMRPMGIGESVIMKIGGWKTNAMFKRYDIVDEADLKEAADLLTQRQLDAKQSEQASGENSHSLAIADQNLTENPASNPSKLLI